MTTFIAIIKYIIFCVFCQYGIRNTAALEIRFNGKTAFTASPYFPGGRFSFLARGGMKDITIEEFKIHDAQPY